MGRAPSKSEGFSYPKTITAWDGSFAKVIFSDESCPPGRCAATLVGRCVEVAPGGVTEGKMGSENLNALIIELGDDQRSMMVDRSGRTSRGMQREGSVMANDGQ